MPSCTATIRATGVPCRHLGKEEFGGFCGIHKNQNPPHAAAQAALRRKNELIDKTPSVRTALRALHAATDAIYHAPPGIEREARTAELEQVRRFYARNREEVRTALENIIRTQGPVRRIREGEDEEGAFLHFRLENGHDIAVPRLVIAGAAAVGGAADAAVGGADAAVGGAGAADAADAADAAVAAAALAAATAAAAVTSRSLKNASMLIRCPNFSAATYQTLAENIGRLWRNASLPGYDGIIAYKAIRHSPINDPQLPVILSATLQVLFLTRTYHPHRTEFTDVPAGERQIALDRLAAAVAAARPDEMTTAFLPRSDPLHGWLGERIEQERAAAAAARAAAAQAAEDARAAAALAAFRQRMLVGAVVFHRDPEGGVDLRAFAADAQSVHRSSVQSATERSVRMLLERDASAAASTLGEINAIFSDPHFVPWSSVRRAQILNELSTDYLDTVAFGVRYGHVVDRVWAFIRAHAESKELYTRLGQEVLEGIGMCANGKMARLVNVLQGYDESLFTEPPKEAFREKMARLMKRPVAERAPAAAALFEEYAIVEEERGAWLDALED